MNTAKRLTKKDLAAQARQEAIETLREICPRGSVVYCVLRHCVRSGMMRVVDLFVKDEHGMRRISTFAARATGLRYNERHEGLQIDGCGTDVGFEAVYSLSYALYGTDAEGKYDQEGCYSLRKEWL